MTYENIQSPINQSGCLKAISVYTVLSRGLCFVTAGGLEKSGSGAFLGRSGGEEGLRARTHLDLLRCREDCYHFDNFQPLEQIFLGWKKKQTPPKNHEHCI